MAVPTIRMMIPSSPNATHRQIIEQNRCSWNAAVAAHNTHRSDAVAFLQAGGSTLFPEEAELLGRVSGRRLAHLLCGPGHDSLSLVNLGAQVVGIDLSDEAVASAESLASQTNLTASFVRADVYDWLEDESNYSRFDDAFASYGVLWWLDDLDRFMQGVSRILRPGGRFVLIDFHPIAMMYDRRLAQRFPYSTHGNPVIIDKGVGDYVGKSGTALVPWGFLEGLREFKNPVPCSIFCWSLSEVLASLARANLLVDRFEEYEYCNGYRIFDLLRADAQRRRWFFPDDVHRFALMFSLQAARPTPAD